MKLKHARKPLRLLTIAVSIAAALYVVGVSAAGITDLRDGNNAATAAQASVFAPWSATRIDGQTQQGPSLHVQQDSGEPAPVGSPPLPDYASAWSTSAAAMTAGGLEIRLQQGYFDPLLQAPPVLPAMAGRTHGSDARDYHLLQFHGPIRDEWRDELQRRGIEVLDYVPDFAYIVRAAPTALAQLNDWSALRWNGPFLPAWRLTNELATARLHGDPETQETLLVRGFTGEPVDALANALEAAGANIVQRGSDSGGGVIFEVRAPHSALLDLATIRAVAWIERKPKLRTMNSVARSNQLLRKDLVEQVAHYYGEGQIAAVSDTGLSTGNPATVHADFSGRVVGAHVSGSCSDWVDRNAHGTHVAGSVLGSGVRSGSNPATGAYSGSHAGIAPRAGLLVWATCDDFSGISMTSPYTDYWQPMYNFDTRLRVDNNSWGSSDPNDVGTYNSFARETDRFIRDHPDMVAVFAAGNSGTDANGDGISDFSTTSPPSTAKNVISVAMSESLRASGGYNPGGPCGYWGECWSNLFSWDPIFSDRISNHPNGMAAISGRGPTLSGRLKPDIAAPGSNIVSARSEAAPAGAGWGDYDQYYLFEGGTSMASPMVTGGAVIVRQFFSQAMSHNPSASLVKAVLFNSATDMAPGQYGAGPQQDVFRRPDINQGWGRMNLADAVLFTTTRQPAYFESFPGLTTNQTSEMNVRVRAGGSKLRVTLVWLDAPGTEAAQGALVNDLDLEVIAPSSTTYYGFAGIVGAQRDRYNPFEEVELAAAAAGQYTIRVRGYNVPMGPQSFSLVVTGDLAPNDSIFRNGFD